MEQQKPLHQHPIEIDIHSTNLENAKEMIAEARVHMESMTRGRETLDQKITYFLGLVLVTFSSIFIFGIKPMLHFLVEKVYSPLVIFFVCFSGMVALIGYLAFALFPKNVRLNGTMPYIFWMDNMLTADNKKMLLMLSTQYQGSINEVKCLLEKKSTTLKWSVTLFVVLVLAITVSFFLVPSLAEKFLEHLKAAR